MPNVPPLPKQRTDHRTRCEGQRAGAVDLPLHVSDHLSMGTSDPVGYALVIDALTHAGPASAARISRTVCLQTVFPGIDEAAFPADFARVVATAGQQVLTAPHVAAEPPLAAYAR